MVPQLNKIFQIAYVTNDIEHGCTLFKDRFGTANFTIMEPPGGFMRIALAFAGEKMIELIQPLNDLTGLYADWIAGAAEFVVRHHHFGLLADSREELAAIRAAHVEAGAALSLEGTMEGVLDYLYVDTTPQLGHYLEYIRLEAGGLAMFAGLEGSIFKRG